MFLRDRVRPTATSTVRNMASITWPETVSTLASPPGQTKATKFAFRESCTDPATTTPLSLALIKLEPSSLFACALALSANNAQDQSFGGCIRLDLRGHCFSKGPFYIASPRANHPLNAIIFMRVSNKTTRNVLYTEVLQYSSDIQLLYHFSSLLFYPTWNDVHYADLARWTKCTLAHLLYFII